MVQDPNMGALAQSGVWLPLVEYSMKSGLSLSTIRRKIKTNSIPFRLEKGRYLILFGEQPISGTTAAPLFDPPKKSIPVERSRPQSYAYTLPQTMTQNLHGASDSVQMPIVERTVKMVSEAFEHTLREKDEHIRLLEIRNKDLEERMEELQLLVKVLEEKYSIRY